jgi:uncharacterized protein (TIGR02266 family)
MDDRVEYTLEIPSVGELYSDVAPRLSGDGIFIETATPPPPDTMVGFRVLLPDGVVLLQGHGTVVWTRVSGLERGAPGMAVRFAELDPEIRETIDAVIDAHLAGGGSLFDLDATGDNDTFPTDSLTEQGPSDAGATWRRNDEEAAGSSPHDRAVGEDTDVVDLKFEQAIAHFTEPEEPEEADEARALDEAISAAVSSPATAGLEHEDDIVIAGEEGEGDGGEVTGPVDVRVDDESPAEEVPEDTESPEEASPDPDETSTDRVIPEILDGWRDELEVASRRPEPRQPTAGPTPSDSPWESLLPFDSSDPGEEAPAHEAGPDREPVSTARRPGSAPPGPNRLWLVLPALAIVVVVVSAVLWVGEKGPEPGSNEEAIASLEAAVEAATQSAEQPPQETETTETAFPPAEASVAVPEPTARPRPSGPASRVDSVSVETAAGATEVVIRGNGLFRGGIVDASRLESPPRVLVRIRRITERYETHRIEVGSAEVDAVRIGHHPELNPPMLYVVLDLVSESVVSADGLSVDGDLARMRVRSR